MTGRGDKTGRRGEKTRVRCEKEMARQGERGQGRKGGRKGGGVFPQQHSTSRRWQSEGARISNITEQSKQQS